MNNNMREIKFRAWDGTEMLCLGEAIKRELVSYDFQNFYLRSEYPDSVYLMQYTGLKDKNGKEIYEGDIVTHNLYTKESGRTEHCKSVAIIWDDVKAGFEFDRQGYKAGLFYWEYEIIGNIYENPELLK